MAQRTAIAVSIQKAIEQKSFTLCQLIFGIDIFLAKVFKIRVVFGDKVV